jgi:hypothetical protein
MPQRLLRAAAELDEFLAAADLDFGRFRRPYQTHEAQVQALMATLGLMTGLMERLRLAAEGRRASLRPPLRQVMRDLAVAIDNTDCTA